MNQSIKIGLGLFFGLLLTGSGFELYYLYDSLLSGLVASIGLILILLTGGWIKEQELNKK